MTKLVMLDPANGDRLSRLRPFVPDDWDLYTSASRAPEDQRAALEGADFAISADIPLTAELFAVPGLKAVHKWGVGYDNFDLDAARANGVRVFRTTGANAIAVAETTLGLILSLNRNLVRGHMGICDGRWRKAELAATSMTLSGKTVGIIGMGYIGSALARLLRGFGCTVLYTKRTPLSPAEEVETGAQFAPLDDLLKQADVVTLNCELNDSTRNLIDAGKLAMMKPDALLINVARGGILVESDLADAIKAGHLRGAGVDVFSVEPITPDNPLIGLDQVVLTPHVGAISIDNFAPTFTRMIANLTAVLEGTAPKDIDILV